MEGAGRLDVKPLCFQVAPPLTVWYPPGHLCIFWPMASYPKCLLQLYPNAHICEGALCCICVRRVTSCIQAYKQSEVKTISSESSFVFDGPVSTLQQQHCQLVTVLQHLPPNATQVHTCATTMGIVSHSVCHRIKS